MWPGYLVAVKSLNDGVFLNIDTATKFLGMDTVFDKIRALQKDKFSREEIKNRLLEENGPLVVITKYNSKQYFINDINFELNPIEYSFDQARM